ncbi:MULTISPECIES: hypothetical protein [Azospirillum]|uniref:hypothetical protein n=1 Tax=Azospirillum TaxID=191 RepID=UPI001304EF00|nr:MULTISPECIES: hypothetical protein [Azospirillum]
MTVRWAFGGQNTHNTAYHGMRRRPSMPNFPQYADDSRCGGAARHPATNLCTNTEAEAEIRGFQRLLGRPAVAAPGHARALHEHHHIISMLMNARAAGRGCAGMKRKAGPLGSRNYLFFLKWMLAVFRRPRGPSVNPFAQH